MSEQGETTRGSDPQPGPGAKWYASYDPRSDAQSVAQTLIAERLARLEQMIDRAAREPTVKRIRKVRVATRRADMAIRFVEPVAHSARAKRARREMRDVRRAGGAVRRCDLFIERLARIIDDAGASDVAPAATSVIGHLAAERSAAMDEFIAAIERSRDRPINADRFLEPAHTREGEHAGPPVPPEDATTAAQLAYAMLRSTGTAFIESASRSTLEIEPLHDLRIMGKRLRYATELAVPAIGEDLAARLIGTIVPLQDELGSINDLAELAEELSAAMSRVACVPGSGTLVSGCERLFLASAAERDRRLGAFAKGRAASVAEVSRALSAALRTESRFQTPARTPAEPERATPSRSQAMNEQRVGQRPRSDGLPSSNAAGNGPTGLRLSDDARSDAG